ncbi:acyltransferase [Neobacillus soli]|uniref:acyltransferase n=1 Tax=Neobacillus soli TaxID=220688 RepID=UPI000824FF80|nr:acyltransferase [Neobacillus soli]
MKINNFLFTFIKNSQIYIINVVNKLLFYLKKVAVEDNVICNGLVGIYGPGTLTIKDNTIINSGIRYNPVGDSNKTTFFMGKNANISIGKNCGISNSSLVAFQSIIIEDNVLIGNGCKIYDTDFHSLDYRKRKDKPDTIYAKKSPVVIKESAFIGAYSIILKGVIIGEKSIVGAGSVVTRSIPDYEIWAGNPAKFIRKIGDKNNEKKENIICASRTE